MSTRLEVAVILQLAVRLQHRIAFRFGVWILLHVKAVGHPDGGTFLLRNQAIFIGGGHIFAGIATGARLDDRLTGIGNLDPDVFGSARRQSGPGFPQSGQRPFSRNERPGVAFLPPTKETPRQPESRMAGASKRHTDPLPFPALDHSLLAIVPRTTPGLDDGGACRDGSCPGGSYRCGSPRHSWCVSGRSAGASVVSCKRRSRSTSFRPIIPPRRG